MGLGSIRVGRFGWANEFGLTLSPMKNTEIVQDVSISGFFQFWFGRISFFPLLFSHIFDLFNASKIMLQLILTLGFS